VPTEELAQERASDRRRDADRRSTAATFRYPERRTGFDRRAKHEPGSLGHRYSSLVRSLAEGGTALLVVLVLFNILNVVDALMTAAILEAGGSEANPVMARLYGAGVWQAVGFKVAIGAAMTATIWSLRRYRRIVEIALVILAVFIAVVLYEIVGMALVL
jgi:hypothetical protein